MLKDKINSKSILILFIMINIIMVNIVSFAADNTCKLALGTSDGTKEIKRGETITLLVRVSDIDAGDGITIMNAIMEYDEDTFDIEVSSDDDNKWNVSLNETSLTVSKKDNESTSEDQIIAKISLTSRLDAELGEKTFALRKIDFSTGNETFSIDDVVLTIPIVQASSSGDDNQGNTTGNTAGNTAPINNQTGNQSGGTSNPSEEPSAGGSTNTGSGTGGSTSTGSSTTTGTGSSVKTQDANSSSLPKTGMGDILIAAIIITSIISVWMYIKYRRAY